MLLLALQACTSQQVNRSVYEALYQKQCMDRVAAPNCDPQHQSYDDYNRSREALLKEAR